MSALWSREPVLTLAVVQALIGLLVSFGVDLTGDQTAAIMGVSAAVLGWVARTRVSPVVPPPS